MSQPLARRALTGRRWTGAVAFPATFAALIAATLLDPLNDFGPVSDQVAVARRAPDGITGLGLTELLAAVLFGLTVVTLVGVVRRRGAGFATAAGAVGVLGLIGLSFIAVSHFFLAAGAAASPSTAAAIIDRMHASVPEALVLFIAPQVTYLLLAIATFRAGFAPLWSLVLLLAFLVLDFVPLPGGELIPLLLGLVGAAGVGVRLVRARGHGGAGEPADRNADAVTSGA